VAYNSKRRRLMALETITIELDSETAKAYRSAPASDQMKMQALLRLWLMDGSGFLHLERDHERSWQEGPGSRPHA
jgi:hypothetical protein